MLRFLKWTPLVMALCGSGACVAQSASEPTPLALERTIPLAGVKGRIDHFAIDSAHRRLFVAELGNGSVEAIDLAKGQSLGRIDGLMEPQGVGYLAQRDELAVATGGDGMLRFYRAADLDQVGAIKLGEDADNVRVDQTTGRVIVGFGSGALAVIDPATRQIVGRAALPAHPESFQLDGRSAYVNLPNAGRIDVVDVASGRRLATWPNGGLRFNFPMALDPGAATLATVYRFPAKVVLFDIKTGARRQTLDTCGDADDVFFDRRRGRLYAVCGGGAVDVFERVGGGYSHSARIDSRGGARTGLFSPELDRLYVAAPAREGRAAAILVYRPSG